MKNTYLKTILLSTLALSPWANSYEKELGDKLDIDIVNYCKQHLGKKSCHYEGTFNVNITCSGSEAQLRASGDYIYCYSSNGMLINTSAPIAIFKATSPLEKTKTGYKYLRGTPQDYDFRDNQIVDLTINYEDYYPAIRGISINTGNPTFVKNNLIQATNSLRLAYVGVLRNTSSFKNQIAKSHRGHLDRFTTALKNGVAILEETDKNENLVNSIVNWKVQENSRLVVAFGAILDELLTDYDDVESLKMSIKSMRTLVEQLRGSYGWERSLSGKVSKASSTLLDVVRLELQELGAIKMAIGENVTIYTKLLKTSGDLKAKVDASKSGDMRAQRDIYNFVDVWNDQTWQSELSKLVNAGPDVKNLVTPKLTMLLQAMESLEDMSEAGFQLPN